MRLHYISLPLIPILLEHWMAITCRLKDNQLALIGWPTI